jgi:hypothetical protein
MMDKDIYIAFKAWFTKEVDGDRDFDGQSADDAIAWANGLGVIRVPGSNGNYVEQLCLDALLCLPSSGMGLREFVTRLQNYEPHPFRTMRRIGGDHDRGFSERANDILGKRMAELSEPKPELPTPQAGNGAGPLRPPLKNPS